jgi:hypothetical protein
MHTEARTRRLAGTIVLASLVILWLAPPTAAGRGVSVDLRQVQVSEGLARGRSYALPTVTVRNPGDEQGTYRASAGGIENDEFLDPADSWFQMEPREFQLDPTSTKPVHIKLILPSDVPPGEYLGIFRFELVAEGAGALVGAAAGVEVRFIVTEADGIDGFLRSMGDLIELNRPWSYLLPIGVLVVLVALWASRHIRIRIETR